MKGSDAAKWIAAGFVLVVAVEVVAIVMAHHRYVLMASGAAAAVVLLAGRRLLDGDTEPAAAERVNAEQAESMQHRTREPQAR